MMKRALTTFVTCRAVTAGKRGSTSSTQRDFWMSDIAIDDVIFTQGGAPDSSDPYIDPADRPSPTPTPARKSLSAFNLMMMIEPTFRHV